MHQWLKRHWWRCCWAQLANWLLRVAACRENLVAQCGDPKTQDIIVAKPTIVPDSRRYVQVSVGGKHNCAVDTVGDIWCWG